MESVEAKKYVTPEEACLANVSDSLIGYSHCNATWDTITCWSPTMAGQVAQQTCPYIFGAPEDSFVYKSCGNDGQWTRPEIWSGFGYSDYSECVAHLSMIEEIFDIQQSREINQNDGITKLSLEPLMIAYVSLLAVSLIFLGVTMFVLICALPKSVSKSTQYTISKNLFYALFMETLVHLIQNVLVILDNNQVLDLRSALDAGTLCVLLISITEFFRVTVYMWLLLQTRHSKPIMVSGQTGPSGFLIYYLTGWGIPVIPTVIWAVAIFLTRQFTCWTMYKSDPLIWIVDASKIVILVAIAVCLTVSLKRFFHDRTANRYRGSYRRIYNENTTCLCYFVFIVVLAILRLLTTHAVYHSFLQDLCRVVVSVKGTVMSVIFLTLNDDLRKFYTRRNKPTVTIVHHANRNENAENV